MQPQRGADEAKTGAAEPQEVTSHPQALTAHLQPLISGVSPGRPYPRGSTSLDRHCPRRRTPAEPEGQFGKPGRPGPLPAPVVVGMAQGRHTESGLDREAKGLGLRRPRERPARIKRSESRSVRRETGWVSGHRSTVRRRLGLERNMRCHHLMEVSYGSAC